MKKFYTLFVALTLCASGIAQAQSLAMVNYDQTTEANSSYLHEVKAHLTVENLSSTSVTYHVARMINGAAGVADSNYFCWDLCYGTGTDSSTFLGVTIAPGMQNSDFYVGFYIRGNSTTNSDSVVFRFYNVDDPNDFLDLPFYLNVSPTVSVEEALQPKLSTYPNPAADRLHVELGNVDNATVRLMNLAGVTVKRAQFNGSRMTMDVRELPSGVYILQALNNGEVITAQRVVVSH